MIPTAFLNEYDADVALKTGSSVDDALAWLRGLARPPAPRPEVGEWLKGFSWLEVSQVGYRGGETAAEPFLSPWVALSRLDMRLAFLVTGRDGAAQLYWGLEGRSTRPLQAAFDALWPGSEIVPLERPPALPQGGVVQRATGWPGPAQSPATEPAASAASPAPVAPPPEPPCAPVDLVLRAAGRCEQPWAWLVIAEPAPADHVQRWSTQVMDRITRLRETQLLANTVTALRRSAQALAELLEAYLATLAKAFAEGAWLTYSVAISAPQDVQVLGAALAGVYGRPAGQPEPWVLTPCQRIDNPRWSGQATLLLSTAVAQLAAMPREEHPGIAVSRTRAFDVVPPAPALGATPGRALELGPIMEAGRDLPGRFSLPLDDLTTHLFVAGITGSGKSTTVRSLVQQAAAQGVRVLVIEPVKREYRNLPIPGLRRYSLGEPGCDLRLNPFAFEAGELGVQVTTHVDLLKALFAAAYVLYPPMPYILERALHEVYADRGWDFASGACWRAPGGHELMWPTLGELRDKVGEIVLTAGYGPRLEPEIRAALEVRIDNLRLGAKGVLLDVRPSVTLDELTNQPTVLELQGIGDAEQRAFLLGLLLMKLYEGCLAHGPSDRLRLLVVLEEAHRLLSEENPAGPDAANPQGKAVQTFGDMLAELRAYGVGLVIAEQSPSRITRQVLKNTGAKLAHQLIDEEEWRLMGGAMALDEADARALATLPRGQVLAFAARMDRPLRVHVEPRDLAPRRPDPQPQLAPGRIPAAGPAPDPRRTVGLELALAADEQVRGAFTALACAALLADGGEAARAVREFDAVLVGRAPVRLLAGERDRLAAALRGNLAGWVAGRWGRWGGWPFAVEAQVRDQLAALLEGWAAGKRCAPPRDLPDLLRADPPFAGCAGCPQPCTYRAFVRLGALGRPPAGVRANPRATLPELKEPVLDRANALLSPQADRWPDILRCAAAHVADGLGWPATRQRALVGAALAADWEVE